jgi:hypothetical protein
MRWMTLVRRAIQRAFKMTASTMFQYLGALPADRGDALSSIRKGDR